MGWTHLEDTKPKARKRYQCYLCEEPIDPGEQHVKRAGVNEDGLSTIRMHLVCEAVTVANEWDEDRWDYVSGSDFREELAKYVVEQGGSSDPT